MTLHVVVLEVTGLGVGEAARRLAHRDRVTAWAGRWSTGGLLTCDPVPGGRFPELPPVAADPAHPHAVGGGWFGYRSFGATASFPAQSWAFYRDVLRFDGTTWYHEALLDGAFDAAAAARRAAELTIDLNTPARFTRARLEMTRTPDATAHVVAVERCGQAIRRGEIYQANIACQVHGRLHGSPHDAWARLVEAHAPARAGLVADPSGTAVSASPELFLRRRGREVDTAPIKGTRPRTGAAPDAARDAAQRERLSTSAKDAAENVMIVDLMRNDLARVCAEVTVPRLLRIEPHPGVWHLVSTVRATLRAGAGDAELLDATFPPGSVTGTPKIRAVALIEELEDEPRGLFTGALGYLSPLAGTELAVAIRTLEVAPDGTARLGVGGGVTVDSTPVEEWGECRTKAAPVLGTLGARWPGGPGESRLARPDQGLFETLLVIDGRPRRLAEHVRRLTASFGECFGRPLTADLPGAVTAALAGRPGAWRVRVEADPCGGLRATASPTDPVPLAEQPGLVLAAHRLGPAGAPRHKFVDRAWIDRAEAPLGPGRAALFVDDRGLLLESTRSSVAVVLDGRITLPPLDGRILPGTARRALLDALDGADLPYDLRAPGLDELADADGMFLLNAVRGVQWVREAPGADWAAPDPLTVTAANLLDTP